LTGSSPSAQSAAIGRIALVIGVPKITAVKGHKVTVKFALTGPAKVTATLTRPGAKAKTVVTKTFARGGRVTLSFHTPLTAAHYTFKLRASARGSSAVDSIPLTVLSG
jgi:hypothetical protein